jgi:hypothetical protein
MKALTNLAEKVWPSQDRDVELQLAEELNQMSFQEREILYEEIHGVESAVKETPEFIEHHLQALDIEIQLITVKPAYELALRQSPEYIKSSKFCLMFLRTEHFVAKLAAHRLVSFLENKCSLFGPETLGRRLLYSDLDEDTRFSVEQAVFQWLPARDSSGRAVFMNMQPMLPKKCYKNAVDMVRRQSCFF